MKSLSRRFGNYSREQFRRDMAAGLTVAFVALPQSMAYALIAGVKPEYGLYAFIVGAIVGGLAGSSRHLQTGPTNATSIVVASTLAAYAASENFMGLVFLLGFLAGVFQLGAGLLKLGNLTQFISRSVLTGFIAAAGLLIVVNQLPNLLGLPRGNSSTIVDGLIHLFVNWESYHTLTLIIGLGTMLLALLIRQISPKTAAGVPLLPAFLIAILAAAGAAALFQLDQKGVKIIGDIAVSLPPPSLPWFEWKFLAELAPGAMAIALIGFAESTSASKTVAAVTGDVLDADREFTGQGLAKIAAAFLSGIPVSGSLTRTVLNYRAGAATKLANAIAGLALALMVLFLGPATAYIPLAALAGIVVLIAASMVDVEYIKLALRSTRRDPLALGATFVAALFFPLDTAIYIGVGISLALFLRRVRVPHLAEMDYEPAAGFRELPADRPPSIPELAIVQVSGEIFFGGVDLLEEEIKKITRRPGLKVLILRLKRAFSLDASSIVALTNIHNDLVRQGKLLLISGVTGETEKLFRRCGFEALVGREHIFTARQALFQSTLEALDYAVKYINIHFGKNYPLSRPGGSRPVGSRQ